MRTGSKRNDSPSTTSEILACKLIVPSAQRSGVQPRAPAITEPDATTPAGARVAPNASNDARRESPRAKRSHFTREAPRALVSCNALVGEEQTPEPVRHRDQNATAR